MYNKEHLIHESVKVLRVLYYLIIVYIIKIVLGLTLNLFFPEVTITYDEKGKTKTTTTRYAAKL